MPVYIRSGELDIPAPSISSLDSDDEAGVFLLDPDQVVDELPQPFRAIDRTLCQLFDQAWDEIILRGRIRDEEARRIRPPSYSPKRSVDKLENAIVICQSPDLRYLFVSFESGELAAFDGFSLEPIADWKIPEYNATIAHLQCFLISIQMYVMAVIDDMGFARILIFANDTFYPVHQFYEQSEGSPKCNVYNFNISNDGEFCGLALDCDGDSWLEFHRIPRDNWVSELEVAQKNALKKSQSSSETLLNASETNLNSTTSEAFEVKFSPLIIVLKVKQPLEVLPSNHTNLQEGSDKAGLPGTIGNGGTHFISEGSFKMRKGILNYKHMEEMSFHQIKTTGSKNIASWHFLNTASSVTTSPVCVCIWWNYSNLLQFYPLQQKVFKDVELKPEIVWPMGGNVTCTSVSNCTNIIAVGLDNGCLNVFDMNLSTPRPVVLIEHGEPIKNMHILDDSIYSETSTLKNLSSVTILLQLQNGAVYTVNSITAEPKLLLKQLSDKQERYICPLPHLSQIFLSAIEGKDTCLHNTVSGELICSLLIQPSLESPLNRFTFSYDGEILYTKNDDQCVDEFALQEFSALSNFRKTQTVNLPFNRKTCVAEHYNDLLEKSGQHQAQRNNTLAGRWRVMNKELEVLISLKSAIKSPQTTCTTPSRWSHTTERLIAHNRALTH